jgi:hypothetical protein
VVLDSFKKAYQNIPHYRGSQWLVALCRWEGRVERGEGEAEGEEKREIQGGREGDREKKRERCN